MPKKPQTRPDLYLLISLLLVILLHPVLDHGLERRVTLGALIFVPVILATVRLAQIKGWLWPSGLLMLGALVFTIAGAVFPNRTVDGMKWAVLTVFFGITVVGLFSYLKNARSILDSHLYTAVSVYLLLGLTWFALYSAIDVFYPGSILRNSSSLGDRPSELLYFSLITLSTVGYGDIVPLHPEVRMLAALEGIIGVLYIAITVALLVSSYKGRSEEPRLPTS
ncbi:MAG: ion channel [Candidatus Korobacteraceae bacterium]